MSQERWAEVDRYIVDLLVAPDEGLDEALVDSHAAGLPPIAVAPNQGKMLHLLARIQGAKSILEVGTLAGYSTIWLARALPADGHLVTLELEPSHAAIAETNLKRAGVDELVTIRIGRAYDTLASMVANGTGPFDFVFIDADKTSNADYFSFALQLTRPGSVIIVDNVVRNGGVIDPESDDPSVLGTRKLNERMAAESRVSVTEVQTVGSKGHDGFALALVLPD